MFSKIWFALPFFLLGSAPMFCGLCISGFAALASWFGSLGLNGFVVNTGRHPFDKVKFSPNFDEHFELVAETRSARLYRIRVRSAVQS